LFQGQHHLSEILEREPLAGSFLFDRGINFMHYPEHSLEEVCRMHNLASESVLCDLQKWPQLRNKPSVEELSELPLDLLLAFLQNSHQRFLWRRLPYMREIVENLNEQEFNHPGLISDIKLIFPIFAEDFIHHIHDEEDNLFRYVNDLYDEFKSPCNPGKLYFRSSGISLHELAKEHSCEDDEMKGIRELTNNYTLPKNASLNLKVIFAELKSFEKELRRHARIENELLFPKAVRLERLLNTRINKTSRLN
jgi:regulator of cell morphogenesis and NO signaling